jgi:hypothetical protein
LGRGQRTVHRGKVNYSDLLQELQNEQNNSHAQTRSNTWNQENNKKQNIEKEEQQETTVLSRNRQRIMSDENIKYFYDGRTNTIHDKNCRHVRSIPDSELCYSSYYITDMRQCKECNMRAYIHAGAKDYNNYGVYQQLFERMNADINTLRHIYIDCGMKTEAFFNVLTIWNNEDTWKIEIIDKKGMVRLLHNNYHIDKTGKRCFDQGFHVQSDYLSCTRIDQAVDAIATYSFDMHSHFATEQRQHNTEQKQPAPVQKQRVTVQKQSAAEQKQRMSYYQNQTNEKENHRIQTVEASKYIGNDKNQTKIEDKNEHITLLQQIKNKLNNIFAKNQNNQNEEISNNTISIKIEDFNLISEKGLPRDGDRCIYIWRTKEKELRWQVGIYDRAQHSFFITFGESTFVTDKSKVIAWKRITTGEGIYGIEDNQ